MKHYTEILVELYRRGDFSQLGLFDKQLQAITCLEDNTVNELLYGGSARSGKSYLGSVWKILRRLAYPKSYGLIARAEYSKLRDTTLRTYMIALNSLGLERDVDYKATGIPMTIEFANGSVEYFREINYIPSDPEFDRLGSYDLTDALLDEAQQIHSKAISVLKGRFSVTVGEGWQTIPKSLYTCNPAKNWIYTEFVLPSNNGNIPARKKFIAALPKDNPHVPQSFFDNLMTADEVTKQRLLYGNFDYDSDPTALIEFSNISNIWSNIYAEAGYKYVTADVARFGSDKAVIMVWDGLKVIDMITYDVSKTTDIQNAINALRTKHKIQLSNIVVDEDGVGGGVVDSLRCQGFVNGSRPNNPQYANLKTECGYKLAEMVQYIYFEASVGEQTKTDIEQELGQLKTYNSDKDGKLKILPKEKIKENIGRSPDYLDAFIMRMYFEVKPKQSYGGATF